MYNSTALTDYIINTTQIVFKDLGIIRDLGCVDVLLKRKICSKHLPCIFTFALSGMNEYITDIV